MHEDHIYDLIKLLVGKRPLRNKRVFKLTIGEYGCPPRYKAYIVVKGFQHKKGVDFNEIFSPVNLEIE